MKILYRLLLYLHQLLSGLVYFCCYPILWLFLQKKEYTEALSSYSQPADILIHAASLGEINALGALIKELLSSGYRVNINTITVSGKKRAQELFPNAPVRLAPFDILHLKLKQFKQMQPKLILIAETEIWPNMLYAAKQAKIPVLFINARISEKSLKSFRQLRGFWRYVSGSVQGILAQSERDAYRFGKLFVVPIRSVGNLKFALDLPPYVPLKLRTQYGYSEQDFILVWGSSRPGEEALLLKILPKLQQEIAHLKLIIAPRHPKRVPELQELLRGYDYRLYSEKSEATAREILLINALGILNESYSMADICIVGGSFGEYGGHNPLEPAFYQRPIIMGPDFRSCADSVKCLAQKDAIIISQADYLAENILKLYHNIALRIEMGARAKRVLSEHSVALLAHQVEIAKWL